MGFFNAAPLESEGTFISRFCIQLILILILPRILHELLLKRLLQPRVISEILSGIILGPSCLGQIHGFTEHLFPARSLNYLEALGAFGVILFLFMTGCHLKPAQLWKYKWKALLCSFFPIGLTLAVSPGLALLFGSNEYTAFNDTEVMILIAILLSVPAEAVMARILAERGLLGSELGSFSMATDMTGLFVCFILLAAILAIHGAQNPWKPHVTTTLTCSTTSSLVNPDDSASLMDPLWILLVFIGFVVLLLTVFRAIFTWMAIRVAKKGRTDGTTFVFAITLNYLAAWFTQTLTISDLIGPICLGLFSVPRAGPLSQNIESALGPMTVGLLMPVFFALVGLKTDFSLLSSTDVGLAFVLLGTLWATTFVGALSMATLLSRSFEFENFYFATLRTCKGLTALTILNILLSVQVITPLFYSLIVLYAILSCAIVSPLICATQYLEERWLQATVPSDEKGDLPNHNNGPQNVLVIPQVGALAAATATLAAWICNCLKGRFGIALFVRFVDDLDNLEEFIPFLQNDPIPRELLASDPILGTCQMMWKGLRPAGIPSYKVVVAPALTKAFVRTALGQQRKDGPEQEPRSPFRHLIIGHDLTTESEELILAALDIPHARVFIVTGQTPVSLVGIRSALVVDHPQTNDGPSCMSQIFQEQLAKEAASQPLAVWSQNEAENRPQEFAQCENVFNVFERVAENDPPVSFDAIFCKIPHSKTKLLALLQAASHSQIPVVFESDYRSPDLDLDQNDSQDDKKEDLQLKIVLERTSIEDQDEDS